MKHLLITTIAAVLLVGCGQSLSEFKDSQLRSAIKEGSIENVKKAIANGANVNALVRAPLYQAASRGHMEIVQLLIANGADVNVKGYAIIGTPLHSAVFHSRKEIAELLISKGADVNAKRNDGKTPLDLTITRTMLDKLRSTQIKAAKKEIGDLLRKHGGKRGEELKAEGK